MSQSAGLSVGSKDATGLALQLADYYLWEEPDRGIRVYLNLETVDRLQVEVLRGLERCPGADAEVGGILIGRTELDGERTITLIEDFAPVRCSYSSGPHYCLSKKDAVNFEAALARCSSDTGGLSVVGYYRSHNRDDLYLSSDDLSLIQRYFPETDKLFLLVKTLPSKACTAGFFFWEDGHIQSEFTYLEVPFAPIRSLPAAELTHPTATGVDAPLANVVEFKAKRLSILQSWQLPEAVRLNPRVWLASATAVAAVVITLAGFSYWQSRPTHPQELSPPISSSLGLRVQRKSGSLTLTWDPNSRDVLAAEAGILYVHEGSNQRTFPLNPSQLRSGGVSFDPSGDDIELRFEIDRGGKPTVEEKVHLLLPNIPAGLSEREATPHLVDARRVSDPNKVVKTSQTDTSPQSLSKPAPAKSTGSREQNQLAAPEILVSSRERGRFVAPTHSIQSSDSGVPAASDILLDQPPPIPFETKISELIVTSTVLRSGVPPPPANPAQQPAEGRPAAKSEAPAPAVISTAPEKGGPSPLTPVSSFVGPQLIRQVNPTIAAELKSMIAADVQIDVAVTIDVKGNVSDARVISIKGAAAGLIARDVLQAARLFRFLPARDNNRNVESKLVLNFRFSGGPTK